MGLNKEQLEARRKGLGGTDLAVVSGTSTWKSPLQLYYEKTGEVGDMTEEKETMRMGNVLEASLIQEYCVRAGEIIRNDA